MGIIFQQFNLIPSLSVLDNVALPMIFSNVDRVKRERRAQPLLGRFGVGHVSHKIPAMLSGGQQQRVSVARSMVNDPKILLADEPTGNLDPEVAEEILKLFLKINNSGTAVLMATHNHNFFEKYPFRMLKCENNQVIDTNP
jgi:cell division transport system ATP-binding protein